MKWYYYVGIGIAVIAITYGIYTIVTTPAAPKAPAK